VPEDSAEKAMHLLIEECFDWVSCVIAGATSYKRGTGWHAQAIKDKIEDLRLYPTMRDVSIYI